MQRPLDYEARRRQLALIAAEVIAHEGIDAATFRRIAAQAGCSTTIITNHFDDKKDLLLCVYKIVSEDALTRFEQRVAQDPANIVASLVSLTAADQNSWRGWRVYVDFWEKAIRDPMLASERQVYIARSRRSIESAIAAAYGPGDRSRSLAQLLIALIHGISIQMLFEPHSWSREQIHEALSNLVERARGGAIDAKHSPLPVARSVHDGEST